MKYRSTLRHSPEVSLRDAVLSGSAPDGGLYMPVDIPHLPADFLRRLPSLTFSEIAGEIGALFTGDEISPTMLTQIVTEVFNFPVPLVSVGDDLFILELFHGPTLAFKDFGARFMARLMGYFVQESGQPLTVIVATSGDTGSAVAQAFLGVPGIRVVILYPTGRVSSAQEKQLTTMGQNITALEVSGSFDDCQRLAKQALVDPALAAKLTLTSANSINIGRLIPQIFYYFAGIAQLKSLETPAVFSVPSGNFGNLTGGLFAKRIGLPVAQFIAATNANDVVPEFLRSGNLIPRASRHTLSSAMDVGNPSNFARIVDLYDNNLQAIRHDIWGCSFSDEETLRVMHDIEQRHKYVLDPHTAIGVLGWHSYTKQNHAATQGIVLATAHPAKFADTVARAIGKQPEMPERLAAFLNRPKKSIPFPNRFSELQEFLLSTNS
ncbi:MAG TPA: threonine synthase [Candidatus Dormibacteraeota bacterium]|nr:threonine synthase [Candidatus Dormibacteraeota bacterium]